MAQRPSLGKVWRAAGWFGILLFAIVLPGTAANAKQCVWNKSGFTLTIRWYTPDQALVRGTNLWIQQDATPYQTDTRRSGSGACSDRAGRNIAVLSSVDWGMFKQNEGDTAYSPLSACGNLTGGKDCVLSNASTDLTPALYQFLKTYCNAYDPYLVDWYTFCTTKGADSYPRDACDCGDVAHNVPKFFTIAWPTLERYTDVWGSIWDPQYCDGCGGPL